MIDYYLLFVMIFAFLLVIAKRLISRLFKKPNYSEGICITRVPDSSTNIDEKTVIIPQKCKTEKIVLNPSIPCVGVKDELMPKMSCGDMTTNIDVDYENEFKNFL